MAEVKVEKPRSGERGVTRRGEYSPGYMSPFSLMRRLSDELDRAFGTSFSLWPGGAETWAGRWSPAVEVCERDNKLKICADLPGMTKDDIKLELTNEGLILKGERKREHEERHEGYHRTERSYGQFYRLIPVPENIDPDKIRAEFKNGVLEIDLPIPESARERRKEIPIKT